MKNNKGWTLIELLVVVLIIGILAAIAVPQYQKAVRKSELSTLKAKTKAIAQAVNAYYLTNNTPASYEALDISLHDVSSVDNSQSGLIEINFSGGSYCKIWDPTWKMTACFTKEPKMGFYYTYDTLKPSHCMALNSRETDKKVCKQEATSSESSYSTYTYYYY